MNATPNHPSSHPLATDEGRTPLAHLAHRDLVSVAPETSVAEAARRMRAADCGSVLVDRDGETIGIWTEADALRLDLSDPAVRRRPLEAVMSAPVASLPEHTTADNAQARMTEAGIRHLLVTNAAGHAVGVVSQTDLVTNRGLEAYLRLREVHTALPGDFLCVSADHPLSMAAQRMAQAGQPAAVVAFDDNGWPGIITERDVVRVLAVEGGNPPLAEAANRPLIAVDAGDSLLTAWERMREHGIRRVGVTDAEGDLLGLVGFADLLATSETGLIQRLEQALAETRAELRDARREKQHREAEAAEHYEQYYRPQLERYKAIFDTVPVGVYRSWPEGEGMFEEVNPAMVSLFGAASSEELLGHTPAELFTDPEQRHTFRDTLLAHGEVHRHEVAMQTLDGHPLRAAITARVRHTDTGEPYFDGVVEDVTERYQAEQERSQALAILEVAPDYIGMADTEGNVLYQNPALNRILGGKDKPLELHLDEDHPAWAARRLREEALPTAAREGVWQGETALLDTEGHTMPVSQTVVAHRDETGHVQRYSTIMRDVSAQHELETELRRETTFNQAIVRNLPGIFYLIDAEGRFVRWNHRLAEVTGYESENALASVRPLELYKEDEQALIQERIQQVFQEGWATAEAHLRHRDGTLSPYYLTGFRVALEGEPYLLGVGLDISERVRAEAELERSNAELEAFAYAVSHDLQEPLRIINSYLGLLQRRYGDALDERAGHYITATTDAAERMRRMIQDLLEYSRIKRMGEEFRPVDLDAVAEEVQANLGTAISDSGAEITVDPLPTVEGDRGQLLRLLQNLLSNAIKYGPPNDVPRIHVTSERQDGHWAIAVADNGLGIDPGQAERVFQVFQRLHTRDEHEGTGAGLALAQRIVERHGGQIWVESKGEGSGSTFRFTLPAASEAGV